MGPNDFNDVLTGIAEELTSNEPLKDPFAQQKSGDCLPSGQVLRQIISLLRAILFPGYYGDTVIAGKTLSCHLGVNIERLFCLLRGQIYAVWGFAQSQEKYQNDKDEARMEQASRLTATFISKLPELRRVLYTDVEAIYNGDPAAESYSEVICCYPAIKAISNYRIAHELLGMGIPLIPRSITEMAHSETGIDIHPGARIGEFFSIDHGTGVVIGATSIIGRHVKLYQGVTLGAKSFPLDKEGNPIKGIPRHPILEDNVIVYSNATILGRVTIGHDAIVGGNIWVTEDVPAGAKLIQSKARR